MTLTVVAAESGMITDAVAAAWQASASTLAAWAVKTMVNRIDVWGLYTRWVDDDGVEHSSMTAPPKKQRGRAQLAEIDLVQHFKGVPGQIKGLHSTSPDNTCRWFAYDFDNHDHDPATAGKNFEQALLLIEHLHDYGFEAFLEDSNGDGGYHVWVLLTAPMPSAVVYAFAQQVATELGLDAEVFPKQADIGSGFGNFLRIPGKHHSRNHWSRIYHCGVWLEGKEAIEAIRNTPVNATELLPAPAVKEELEQTREINHQLSKPKTGRRSDVEIAKQCLQYLGVDVADDRALWIKVGQILYDLDPGLLTEWDAWSQQSSKYKENECAGKWKGFGRRQGKVAKLGTLVYLARKAGANIHFYDVPRVGQKSDAAVPNAAPAIDGPLGIRLIVSDVTKTPRRQSIRFTVHIAGQDTEMELAASDTGGGVRAAVKDLSEIYASTQPQPLTSEQQQPLTCWLRKVLAGASITKLGLQLDATRPKAAEPAIPTGPSMFDIALKYMRKELELAFTDAAGGLWSERQGRVFDRNEFTNWLPPQLLSQIGAAFDYPEPTPLDPTKPIRHLQLTLRPVWTDLVMALPKERHAVALGPNSAAAAAFRQSICKLWLTPETWMKFDPGQSEVGRVERMSLASRVRELVHPASRQAPRWDRVLKGVNAFYRVEKAAEGPVVWLAMRVDLCRDEIKGASIDSVATQEDLTVLMSRYGLSDTGTVTDRLREQGKQQRICVLSRAMCDYLISCMDPEPEGMPVTDDQGGAVTGVADGEAVDMTTGEVLEARQL
jgi:hypothetical protein